MAGFLFKWFVLPVCIAVAAFAAGWRVHDWRDAAATVKAVQHVVTVTQKQGAVTSQVAVAAQAEHDRIIYRTQTLTKEVAVYVPAAADRNCTINAGFVRLWNGATGLSGLPDAPAESDDAPSGVSLSEVGRADVANYGAAQANAAELAGLQDWIRKQQAVFASK